MLERMAYDDFTGSKNIHRLIATHEDESDWTRFRTKKSRVGSNEVKKNEQVACSMRAIKDV